MESSRVSRSDLHIHSKYSDRPSEWLLRRIGAPESFVEPQELYDRCLLRGMNFVTISDHNRIEGALEIAHLPNTFISVESTTYFPENNAKMHILISGITETQFEEIQRLRENIYELRDYLVTEDIIHTVAHPLFRVNDKLTVAQFEKLLVLFQRFEAINGARDRRANDLMSAILAHLSEQLLAELAEKHSITPVGKTPWIKYLTGGSDDHGGLFAASAYTETDFSKDTETFLGTLRMGRHWPRGRSGGSLQLGRSLYQIAFQYYRKHFQSNATKDTRLMGTLFGKIVGAPNAEQRKARRYSPVSILNRIKMRTLSRSERQLVDEVGDILNLVDNETLQRNLNDDPQRQIDLQFEKVCRVSNRLLEVGISQAVSQIKAGYLIESLQALASLGIVGISIAPYLAAFKTQHKDEAFVRQIADRFPHTHSMANKTGKIAWVTDTMMEVNGVAHTIRQIALHSRAAGKSITVITSMDDAVEFPFLHKNFKPVGSFRLPEYETQKIMLPPFLEMLAYFEEQGFDQVILSTPGPVGLCARAIGKLLSIQITGVYHTDFPRYVQELTDDPGAEALSWQYMEWFYGGMSRIYVPSGFYQRELEERGFQPERLHLLPRGVDVDRFNPSKRSPAFFERFGLNGEFKYLYVGRISKEKNVEQLLAAFHALCQEDPDVALVIVGDGPQLEELQERYRHQRIIFTGFLSGEELASAYASSDLFVFPSNTDTFGNVVLEAHASGLPAVVTHLGGPREIVERSRSGLVLHNNTVEELAKTMQSVRENTALYTELREGALKTARQSSWREIVGMLQ